MVTNITMLFHDLFKIELEYDLMGLVTFTNYIDKTPSDADFNWKEHGSFSLSTQETRKFANYLLKYCDILEEFERENPEQINN